MSFHWVQSEDEVPKKWEIIPGGDLGALAALGSTSLGKLVHEQLALQLTLSRDHTRKDVTDCSWFFFELMIKAMVEHLATANTLHAPRKHRLVSGRLEEEHLSGYLLIQVLWTIQRWHLEHGGQPHQWNSLPAHKTEGGESISTYNLTPSLRLFWYSGKDGSAECLFGLFPPRPSFCHGSWLCLHPHSNLHERPKLKVVFLLPIPARLKKSNVLVHRIHGEGEANEQAALWGLQIDFLRIVSSHEHFIPLNLPQVCAAL